MLLLKNLLFILLAPGIVGVAAPVLLMRSLPRAGIWCVTAGSLIAVCGAAIVLWCVWDFASYGRGTPVPMDEPKRLVVRGLYRVVRNPMYVGVITLTLGWAVYCASARLAAYSALVALAFHLVVRFYEEPHLRRVFGDEYGEYCGRVGRWLPRLTVRPGA
jgi:protein-S-isoprenylcysteine O-methyltransferase Ste14